MGGLGGVGWGHMPDLNSYLTMGSLEIFKACKSTWATIRSSASRVR